MKSREVEIGYEREGFKDYLTIKREDIFKDYELKIIENNTDSGFLPIILKGDKVNYELNGYIDFKTAFFQTIKEKEFLTNCLKRMLEILTDVDNLMLRQEGFIIRPDSIYINEENADIKLIYMPGASYDVKDDFVSFVEFIMKHMDHKDKELILLIYGIYQIVREEHYELDKVIEFINSPASKNETDKDSEDKIKIERKVKAEKKIKADNKIRAEKKIKIDKLETINSPKSKKIPVCKEEKKTKISSNIESLKEKLLAFFNDEHKLKEGIIIATTSLTVVILFILDLLS
ncbi:MAG: DUF6382 domain-containing protein [Lachnospiraceae bacterium]|nr:DUF6382 domain-containing protein [Lachnospiraceae bacterium]